MVGVREVLGVSTDLLFSLAQVAAGVATLIAVPVAAAPQFAVQFNNPAGVFAGDANLTWTPGSGLLNLKHGAIGSSATVVSNRQLWISETVTGDLGFAPNNYEGLEIDAIYNHNIASGGHNASLFGIQSNVTSVGTGDVIQINNLFEAFNHGTGNVHNLFGMEAQAFHEAGANTISGAGSFMAGVAGNILVGIGGAPSGSISNCAEIYGEGANFEGTAAVVTGICAGLWLEPIFDDPAHPSSIANRYGVYILDQTNGGAVVSVTGNNWNFYSQGGATFNQFDGTVSIGAASGVHTGVLELTGKTSGVVSLSVADAAGTWTMKLPTSGGTNGYVLQTNGSGVTSWVAQTGSTGTLTVGTTTIAGGSGTGKVFYEDASNLFQEAANLTISSGNPNVSSGNAYLYNGTPVITAQTALNNFYEGGAGNFTATGQFNFGTGPNCLTGLTTGNDNVGIGAQALQNNTSGSTNLAIGTHSLFLNQTGQGNVCIGPQTIFVPASFAASNNVAIGTNALELCEGNQNIAIGTSAFNSLTMAGNNVGIGFNSGPSLQTGGNNLFLGAQTGSGIVTGSQNTIIGSNVGGLSSSLSNAIVIADSGGNIKLDYNNTISSKWAFAAPLCVSNAAVTGLTPGVLAATTNASIVICDSSGQAYRIPCII